MMPLDTAISMAQRMAARLYERIEINEQKWACMDGKRRSQIGALRALLSNAGVPKEYLPETPFLEPEHLAAYRRRQEAYRAASAKAEEVA